MSIINEQIVTGRAYRMLIDAATKLWQKISFWTKASDVEFNDGTTAETKVGAIKGITTDFNVTEEGYAADMTALAQLYSDIPIAMTQAEYDALSEEERNNGRWYGIYEENFVDISTPPIQEE